MKIRCQVCEAAAAAVLCCADEAALCAACDEKVHAANKLASKHPRVGLSNGSDRLPRCDICKDITGFFFCLEDRALLCRKCDVSIHTMNPLVSAHQRFLLAGVKVGLEPIETGNSSSAEKPLTAEKVSEPETNPPPRNSAPKAMTEHEKLTPERSSTAGNLTPSKRSATMSFTSDFSKMLSGQGGCETNFTASKLPFSGGSVAGRLVPSHLNQRFGYSDRGSSKDDSRRLVESDSSSAMRSLEDDVDIAERLGQVPDAGWTVPQVTSLPTPSGLNWPTNSRHRAADTTAFVPDLSGTNFQASRSHQPDPIIDKRRRLQLK
ncbi:B-box zinc finger protein 22-like protein [Drosera capensis]